VLPPPIPPSSSTRAASVRPKRSASAAAGNKCNHFLYSFPWIQLRKIRKIRRKWPLGPPSPQLYCCTKFRLCFGSTQIRYRCDSGTGIPLRTATRVFINCCQNCGAAGTGECLHYGKGLLEVTHTQCHAHTVKPRAQTPRRFVGARRGIAAASAAPHSAAAQHATLSGILHTVRNVQKVLRERIRESDDSNELAVTSMAKYEDDLACARPPPTKSAFRPLQAPIRPAKRRGLGIDIPGMSTAFGCGLWHAYKRRLSVQLPQMLRLHAQVMTNDGFLPQMPPTSRRTRSAAVRH
jgi:hypothetical protein